MQRTGRASPLGLRGLHPHLWAGGGWGSVGWRRDGGRVTCAGEWPQNWFPASQEPRCDLMLSIKAAPGTGRSHDPPLSGGSSSADRHTGEGPPRAANTRYLTSGSGLRDPYSLAPLSTQMSLSPLFHLLTICSSGHFLYCILYSQFFICTLSVLLL